MAAGGRRVGDEGGLTIRLPVDADRPLLNAVVWGLAAGGLAFGFVVFDRNGLGGPVAVGLPIGVVVGLVAGPLAYVALRRRSRGHRLVCDDDGIAFVVSGNTRWWVPWDDVRSARIVDGTIPRAGRYDPAFCPFLVLDLAPATAPDDASLARHEDRWWFSLLRAETRVPALGAELRRRIPGRVEPARHATDVPLPLTSRDASPSRLFR